MRNSLTYNLLKIYKQIFGLFHIFSGNPIPHVKYTLEETLTWRIIYIELTKMYKKYACKEFLDNWIDLERNCGYG